VSKGHEPSVWIIEGRFDKKWLPSWDYREFFASKDEATEQIAHIYELHGKNVKYRATLYAPRAK
jgi:hypothetical protein